ncbi:MAG: methylmalonyl-CoA mutase family protein, partial [Candidatus Bathyarchaeia archaeon]
VNAYEMKEASPIETLRINEKVRHTQVERLNELKKIRDATAVKNSLGKLRSSFEDPDSNSIYPMLKAVKFYATLGEIVDVGRKVFGDWKEPSIL